MLVEALLSYQFVGRLFVGAQAEFKVAHVIGRQLDTDLEWCPLLVRLSDDTLSVFASFFVLSWSGQSVIVPTLAALSPVLIELDLLTIIK